MEKRKESDSSFQREIEKAILQDIKTYLNIMELSTNVVLHLKNNDKVTIIPDVYSEEDCIIGEIHTHPGKLKAAQRNKVATDILKMLLFEKDYGKPFRKIIIVTGKEEYDQLNRNSYLSEAIKQYGIEVMLCELSESQKKQLSEVVQKQNLTFLL